MTNTLRRTGSKAIPPRDRMWRGTHTVVMFTGIEPPSQHALRAALRRLAAIAPEHRAFLTARPEGSSWVRLDRDQLATHCDRMVTYLPGPAGDPDALLARLHRADDPTRPLGFAVGDDFAAIVADHVLADGRTMFTWLAELWRCALAAETPHSLVHRDVAFPLARGLARAFREDPRRPLSSVRALRARTGGTGAPTGAPVPWRPSVVAISGSGCPGGMDAVRSWRSRHARDTSIAALLFAAARTAAAVEGLALSRPGFGILVDNRRYLGGNGARFAGNLSTGLYLAPARPTSPASVGQALDEAISSARSLVAMAAGAATAAAGRGGECRGPGEIRRPVAPLLNLNYLGRLTPFERLPGGTGSGARFHMLVTPWEPTFVTFFLSELAGRLHVTAAFNDTVFGPEHIRPTVARLCADPVALLAPREPARV